MYRFVLWHLLTKKTTATEKASSFCRDQLLACQEKAEQHVPEETHLSPINTEHTNLSRSKTQDKGGEKKMEQDGDGRTKPGDPICGLDNNQQHSQVPRPADSCLCFYQYSASIFLIYPISSYRKYVPSS
jgi:hypothetical protein